MNLEDLKQLILKIEDGTATKEEQALFLGELKKAVDGVHEFIAKIKKQV